MIKNLFILTCVTLIIGCATGHETLAPHHDVEKHSHYDAGRIAFDRDLEAYLAGYELGIRAARTEGVNAIGVFWRTPLEYGDEQSAWRRGVQDGTMFVMERWFQSDSDDWTEAP